jgi:hypothetical protein
MGILKGTRQFYLENRFQNGMPGEGRVALENTMV